MSQLFHEVYGKYYQLLTKLLNRESSTEAEIRRLVQQEGYGETAFSIMPALLSQEDNWHLLFKEEGEEQTYRRVTKGPITRPLTLLEKRWLKTLLRDPRIFLFLDEEQQHTLSEQLGDCAPLFDIEDVDYFDQFKLGDPYESVAYQRNVGRLLHAIRERKLVQVHYLALDRTQGVSHTVLPEKLEYSQKNDKFRLRGRRRTTSGKWERVVFNLSEINQVEVLNEEAPDMDSAPLKEKKIVCVLQDDRDTLERAMFHFSNYRKVTQKTNVENEYLLSIYYPSHDETELLINVLSFGPFLQVIEPDSFIRQIRHRLAVQKELFCPKEQLPGSDVR